MEAHRSEHVELEATLEAMQTDPEGIDTNLGLLIRVRCLEMDARNSHNKLITLKIAGPDFVCKQPTVV